jgi:ABC-2 type transport system permease protein
VGGICGALLTNLSAWLSGVWFDLELVGGTFRKIAYGLPFVHAVEVERAVLAGNLAEGLPHMFPVVIYAVLITIGAVLLFLRQMKKQ